MADPAYSATGGEPVYRDRQLIVARTETPEGLRFAGEIDVFNSRAVAESLRKALLGAGDAHLDVSRLAFCDISGIRALVDVARSLGTDRKLRLHGLAPELERVIQVTGWTDDPGLAICTCAEGGL